VKLKKNPKILLIPNLEASYDQRMMHGFAEGFNLLNCYARALSAPLSPFELSNFCKNFSIDVVIEVNRRRSNTIELPKGIRHISWIQDVFFGDVSSLMSGVSGDDLLYTLGDAKSLGLENSIPGYRGSLLTGVDQGTLGFRQTNVLPKVDFSLCGFIPAPFNPNPNIKDDLYWYLFKGLRNIPGLRQSKFFVAILYLLKKRMCSLSHVPYSAQKDFKNMVESIYRPLRGELDLNEIVCALDALNYYSPKSSSNKINVESRKKIKNSLLRKIISAYPSSSAGGTSFSELLIKFIKAENNSFNLLDFSEIQNFVRYFSQTYPRLLDRKLLIETILEITNSLELYGPGWEKHDAFKKYHKGILDTQNELLNAYARTRVNLANNTHGLGLHSRTLECMAVGGFVLTHKSNRDDLAGGIRTAFEPGVHYGEFEPENLKETAIYWLKNTNLRVQVGQNAAQAIRDGHTWRHRASQILADLKES
jgi:Glycosyl transferases group 1